MGRTDAGDTVRIGQLRFSEQREPKVLTMHKDRGEYGRLREVCFQCEKPLAA
jgi:hypothetical protein